jgi:lysophospholipase L1-like esterase
MNTLKFKKRLFLVAAGALCAVLTAEIAVRIFFAPKRIIRYTIQRNSAYFSPTLNADSPLFYTYRGIETDKTNYVAVHYPDGRLQKFSFRKPAGTFRVVAVGDSLTEEWNIPGFTNYTDFLRTALERELPGWKIEVLPLGVGGYNTWQEMHFYRESFERLQTDVLILQYCGNDGDVMSLKKRNSSLPCPDNEWPEYEIVGTRIGRPDFSRTGFGFLHSRLLWLLNNRSSVAQTLDRCVQLPGSDEQRTALRWFRDMSRSSRIPFFVVVFPFFDDGNSQAELTYAKGLLDETKVEYLDLLPEFRERGPLSTMGRDLYHPNSEGHRTAAEAILRFLKRQGLLPATE